MVVDGRLMELARKAAEAEGLDPAVVCAVVEQESAWNPWAMRYEPLFFAKYVAPLYTNNKVGATEAYARGFSWGLMQVMGQTARDGREFPAPFGAVRSGSGVGGGLQDFEKETGEGRRRAAQGAAGLEWRS